jgi:hypothetical protein
LEIGPQDFCDLGGTGELVLTCELKPEELTDLDDPSAGVETREKR